MSSALAMILMAGMAVPGDVPEKVTGEVEQGLNLSGEWQGMIFLPHRITFTPRNDYFQGKVRITSRRMPALPRLDGKNQKVEILRGLLVTWKIKDGGGSSFWGNVPVDEGKGRFRIGDSLGIYQYDGSTLRICFDESAGRRPASFCASDSQNLLILHRVKPGK